MPQPKAAASKCRGQRYHHLPCPRPMHRGVPRSPHGKSPNQVGPLAQRSAPGGERTERRPRERCRTRRKCGRPRRSACQRGVLRAGRGVGSGVHAGSPRRTPQSWLAVAGKQSFLGSGGVTHARTDPGLREEPAVRFVLLPPGEPNGKHQLLLGDEEYVRLNHFV